MTLKPRSRSEQLAMIWDTAKIAEKEIVPLWTDQTVCACCGKKIFSDTPALFNRDRPGRVWHCGREIRDPFDDEAGIVEVNREYNECLAKFLESIKNEAKYPVEYFKDDPLMQPPRLPHEIAKRRKERKRAAERKLQKPADTKEAAGK